MGKKFSKFHLYSLRDQLAHSILVHDLVFVFVCVFLFSHKGRFFMVEIDNFFLFVFQCERFQIDCELEIGLCADPFSHHALAFVWKFELNHENVPSLMFYFSIISMLHFKNEQLGLKFYFDVHSSE